MEAIEAAARFAKAGGIGILEPYAKHEEPKVRKKVAWAIGAFANDVGKGLILLQSMMDDSDMGVLTQVVESLSDFNGNGVVMQRLNDMALAPEMPVALRRELASGLGRGYEFPDIVWPGLQKLAADEDPEVRRRVSRSLSNHAEREGIEDVVRALLADSDAQVRRAIAQELRYVREELITPMRPVLEALAETDNDREVQANAVRSLVNGFTPEQTAEHYTTWMGKRPTEEVLRTIVYDIKYDQNDAYKPLLEALTGSEFPEIAEAAREGLAYEG